MASPDICCSPSTYLHLIKCTFMTTFYVSILTCQNEPRLSLHQLIKYWHTVTLLPIICLNNRSVHVNGTKFEKTISLFLLWIFFSDKKLFLLIFPGFKIHYSICLFFHLNLIKCHFYKKNTYQKLFKYLRQILKKMWHMCTVFTLYYCL